MYPRLGTPVADKPPAVDLTGNEWVTLNRLRTGLARLSSKMFYWSFIDSPTRLWWSCPRIENTSSSAALSHDPEKGTTT